MKKAPVIPEAQQADTCPICGAVHWQLGDQLACGLPDHGHRLLFHTVFSGRVVYKCPAHKCPVVITAPRNEPGKGETMTAIHQPQTVPSTEISIQPDQTQFTDKQLAVLRQLGVDGASRADLAVFMHRCQQTGLDPFSGQIYMIGRKTKDGVKQTIQVGVDGYRLIAKRAADKAGKTISYGPTVYFDGDGTKYPEVWLGKGQPAAATVTIYVDGSAFPGAARFASFAQVNRDGHLIGLWATMGDHLLAKCAEVQALRRAFPNDLEGIQADVEQHEQQAAPAGTPWHVAATTAPARRQPSGTEKLLAARAEREQAIDAADTEIIGHWERIGIDDPDEQLALTAQLSGEDFVPDTLTDFALPVLQRIAAQLKGCDDIGQVHALIDRGDKPAG